MLLKAACKLFVQLLVLHSLFGSLLLLHEFPIEGRKLVITSESQSKDLRTEGFCVQSAKKSKYKGIVNMWTDKVRSK
jgi:hypothetical protein